MVPTDELSCPSAQPDMRGAEVFGVVQGEPGERRVAYLRQDAAVDLAHLPDLGGLDPTHVFRIAAACEASHCAHFAGGRCRLAARIVERLEPVVDVLPPCRIRPSCRWFAEHGAAACLRCPQVVTRVQAGDPSFAGVAAPQD